MTPVAILCCWAWRLIPTFGVTEGHRPRWDDGEYLAVLLVILKPAMVTILDKRENPPPLTRCAPRLLIEGTERPFGLLA